MHNVSHYQYGPKSTENEQFDGGSWPSWQLQGLLWPEDSSGSPETRGQHCWFIRLQQWSHRLLDRCGVFFAHMEQNVVFVMAVENVNFKRTLYKAMHQSDISARYLRSWDFHFNLFFSPVCLKHFKCRKLMCVCIYTCVCLYTTAFPLLQLNHT